MTTQTWRLLQMQNGLQTSIRQCEEEEGAAGPRARGAGVKATLASWERGTVQSRATVEWHDPQEWRAPVELHGLEDGVGKRGRLMSQQTGAGTPSRSG